MKNWFQGLTTGGKAAVSVIAAIIGFGVVGAVADPSPDSSTLNTQNVVQTQSVKNEQKTEVIEPVITRKEVIEKTAIPFTSITANDANLEQGKNRTTSGINGEKHTTIEVVYEDGKEVSRKTISTKTAKEPVSQITYTGTKAPALDCPNGTYVNSAGNRVCSPYASSSAPAGASAKCVDGTYSFSQSRRGTCSRHGGVAVWL